LLVVSNWKKVHWLGYPLFAFMLLHVFLSRRTGLTNDMFGWLQFFVAFGGYILLKVLAKNNFLTPLREINEYVGQRYQKYRTEKAR
jgi:DMSO/TMAO reductase YedYZ heme-binding membrane subunit